MNCPTTIRDLTGKVIRIKYIKGKIILRKLCLFTFGKNSPKMVTVHEKVLSFLELESVFV